MACFRAGSAIAILRAVKQQLARGGRLVGRRLRQTAALLQRVLRAGPEPAHGDPGQFVSGSHANEAGARPYKLYIPTKYEEQGLPLVVMLHGCTQTADAFATGTRLNALAEERKCCVLYPGRMPAACRSRGWSYWKRHDQ